MGRNDIHCGGDIQLDKHLADVGPQATRVHGYVGVLCACARTLAAFPWPAEHIIANKQHSLISYSINLLPLSYPLTEGRTGTLSSHRGVLPCKVSIETWNCHQV